MKSIAATVKPFLLLTGWPTAAILLLVSCSLLPGAREEEPPAVYPSENAPVTVTAGGNRLIIGNHTDEEIYHRIFPSEILPVIEWAPCIAPESCPADERIEPGGQKEIAVREIVRENTESITVFWWRYLEKLPGASVPPMEMEEIVVPLPEYFAP